MKKLKVAVVGCGRVSRTAHYDSIRCDARYEFVGVCDKQKDRADHWSAQNKVRGYTDLRTLLETELPDVVSINTPNGTHARLAREALERDVHVIVEKPLAMTARDADMLIELADKRGLRLFTVLQNRYNATNKLLKSCIDKGRFGRISSCNVNVAWRRTKSYYVEDQGWRGRRDLAGGVFTNQCVHYIDMMGWLIGASPVSVYAQMGTAGYPVEVEDHGSAIVTFGSGVVGTFTLTNLAYPKDLEGAITIVGETGYVRLGGVAMNKTLEWHFADKSEEDQLIKEAESSPPTVYGFGHQELYRRVADLLIDGKEDGVIDGHEGRKSVLLLEAMYTSAGTGRPVHLQHMISGAAK